MIPKLDLTKVKQYSKPQKPSQTITYDKKPIQ
jgi:hypothetical protein